MSVPGHETDFQRCPTLVRIRQESGSLIPGPGGPPLTPKRRLVHLRRIHDAFPLKTRVAFCL